MVQLLVTRNVACYMDMDVVMIGSSYNVLVQQTFIVMQRTSNAILMWRQAAELMQKWAPINTSDALELLSPDFRSEEVRSHAVSVLQGHDDEELLYFLLQLVQALRYESSDHSKLAAFLMHRGVADPGFATFLHW